MSLPEIAIRKAELKDIAEVYELLKELSAYEQLPENLQISLETLSNDYIDKAFNCLVAQKPDGRLVGYTVYTPSYSTWSGKMLYLRDIYVRPEVRGTGVGKRLFTATMNKGFEMGCRCAFFSVLEWNPAVEFYKHMGAVNITDKEKYHLWKVENRNFRKYYSLMLK